MKTIDFDYHLPRHLIAQTPIEPRDHSRLMIIDRKSGLLEHRHFYDLPDFLNNNDLLVFNDSKVIPARLYGNLKDSNIKIELLLLRRLKKNIWESLGKPRRKLVIGTQIEIRNRFDNSEFITASILEQKENGIIIVNFSDDNRLEEFGNTPLPPYIKTQLKQPERYQTIYARINGSVAAPTAGLHFTPELLKKLEQKGVQFTFVTLHIGLDTFQPVHESDPTKHRIHNEYGELSIETANIINSAKKEGKRIIAVGTSTVRIIEDASKSGTVYPINREISLYILPGYKFQVIDSIITNFHLPKSTLIMMISAFTGREFLLNIYQEAVKKRYRFYSFGDAMLIF